jgi:hypothetical protein
MKRLKLVSIFLLVFSYFAQSQSGYQVKKALDFYRSHLMQSGEWNSVLTENDIEGSPYLEDEFIAGSVYTTSKTQYVDLPLRYNIYNEQVEFRNENNEIRAIAEPELIEKIEIGETEFVFAPFRYGRKIMKSYFILMLEGNASLYKKPEVMFKEATEPGAYKDAEPAQFVRKSDAYYIRLGKSPAIRVSSKKDLESVFSDEHQNEIKNFIRKNKITPRNEKSLIELVEFYNSL